jgi:hypothetical protein
MKSPLRLAVSLANRVYIGHIDKKGECFLERGKQDVTTDFLKAVIDMFEPKPDIIRCSDGILYKVTVERMYRPVQT